MLFRSSYAPTSYRAQLARRLRPLLRKHGLDAREDEDQPEQRRLAGRSSRRPSAPPALDPMPQPALF